MLLLFLLALGMGQLNSFLQLTTTQMRSLKQDELISYFSSGSMENYISPKDLQQLTTKLSDQFPSFVSVDILGNTYQNNGIKCFAIKTTAKPTNKFVLVGMLHGDQDLISINFIMEQIFQTVIKLSQNDPYAQRIMADKELLIIPVLNFDSFQYIQDEYFLNSQIPSISKNRNYFPNCLPQNIGVDLQRNFLYKFGLNESKQQCDNNYVGVNAFSENESKAIDLLIKQSRPDLIIVLGGGSKQSIIITDNITSNLKTVTKNLGQKYSIPVGNNQEINSITINGDLCQNYAYLYNIDCIMLNLGQQQDIETTLTMYNFILVDLLKQSSASLQLTLNRQNDCSLGQNICSKLSKNEKGYMIVFDIHNNGFQIFNNQIMLDVYLRQNGEQLYSISSYSVLQSSKLGTIQQLKKILQGDYMKFQIYFNQVLSSQSYCQIVILLEQVNFQYNYIKTVKNISLTINLLNALEENIILIDVLTNQLKAVIENTELSNFVKNRPESYILLICFGVISMLFLIICLINRMCFARSLMHQARIQPLYTDEKLQIHAPRHLAESRVNSQVKFTQVAPSVRFDSPRISSQKMEN